MSRLATSIDDAYMLSPGRVVEWAASILYVLLGLETWHLLRVELDYDPEGYRTWLLNTLQDSFTTDPQRVAQGR